MVQVQHQLFIAFSTQALTLRLCQGVCELYRICKVRSLCCNRPILDATHY
jgi:hypothetical protein